jgi:DNA-binding response OmpR family regulator
MSSLGGAPLKMDDARKKRILVVDDDPATSRLVRHCLEWRGYEVVERSSGMEALAWLEWERADLIILDVVMPGLSGFEVCRRLRARAGTRDTPVIFLTAREGIRDAMEGSAAGSDLYLVKATLWTRLVSMVEMFLSRDLPLAKRTPAGSPPR